MPRDRETAGPSWGVVSLLKTPLDALPDLLVANVRERPCAEWVESSFRFAARTHVAHQPGAQDVLARTGQGQPIIFDVKCSQALPDAITRAGGATGEFDALAANVLADAAIGVLRLGHAAAVPGVEAVQDAVERVLIDAGYAATARAYIVYREQHTVLRQDRRTLIEVGESVEEYLHQRDWRVNANANQSYSLGGLILNVAGKVTANYWLSHVYPPEVGAAHRDDVQIEYRSFELDPTAPEATGPAPAVRTPRPIRPGTAGCPGRSP